MRYADDCNVYVRSRQAGARVMAVAAAPYGSLKLSLNEAKSAVASAFGRKFLGYELWAGRGGEVKRAVADRAIRRRTRPGCARSRAAVADAAWPRSSNGCASMCRGGRRTSGWRRHPRSGASWTSGCVTGCGRCNSSTGNAAPRSTAKRASSGPPQTGPTGRQRRTALVARERSGAQRRAHHRPLRPHGRTPSVLTSTSRTARCGPACRVVWEGPDQQ